MSHATACLAPVFVAGPAGLDRTALVLRLQAAGFERRQIVTQDDQQLDLGDPRAVGAFLEQLNPSRIYLPAISKGNRGSCAAGQISHMPRQLARIVNVIEAAYRTGVPKLLYIASAELYPQNGIQPTAEEDLQSGPPDPAVDALAAMHLTAVKLCELYTRSGEHAHALDYRAVVVSNLYGPGDDYTPGRCSVVPALIDLIHTARRHQLPEVKVWGSGAQRRDFIFVDDMADGCVHAMELSRTLQRTYIGPKHQHLNIGSGEDTSIFQLAHLIAQVVGYGGTISSNASKHEGQACLLLDIYRMQTLGWHPSTRLREGIAQTYDDYLARQRQVSIHT